ncbi:MAG: proline racemase family protein [Caldilineaceae bacterium]|nr:proline racemase family protein [Caldilineaceae bacterium]
MRFSNLITAVDVHAGGEPGRVITGGVLDPPGESMFEKMRWLAQHRDDLRLRMLREPRGYPALCCNVILPPTHPDADAGFVIMEQVEYPPMSGSNTICVATVLLETGMVPMREPTTELTLETPAGLVAVTANCKDGKVTQVTFQNVPAFALHLDAVIDVPHLGRVMVDVAWGGMFHVLADAEPLHIALVPENGREIVRVTEMIKAAAREQLTAIHPQNPAIRDVTIGQLVGPATLPGAHLKNATTVSSGIFDWNRPESWTGVLDRSPCGTGTCAKMAILHAKSLLALHEDFHYEGILGTVFSGRLVEEVMVGAYRAVTPTLSGQAWITGIANYVVDPGDPFPDGFTVGDIWG